MTSDSIHPSTAKMTLSVVNTVRRDMSTANVAVDCLQFSFYSARVVKIRDLSIAVVHIIVCVTNQTAVHDCVAF